MGQGGGELLCTNPFTPMIIHFTNLDLMLLFSLYVGPWVVFPLTLCNLPMMLSPKAGASFKVVNVLWCACCVVPQVMALNWWALKRTTYTPETLATPIICLAAAAPLMLLVQFVYLLKKGRGRE